MKNIAFQIYVIVCGDCFVLIAHLYSSLNGAANSAIARIKKCKPCYRLANASKTNVATEAVAIMA